MQTSELAKKYNKLSGDEECINFRPSPNFKHMKKYLKSKFEEANSSPNQSSDRSSTPEEQETNSKPEQATSSNMAQRVQPPLPPNSPPPEVLIIPKQEVEDNEYNDKSATQTELKTEKEEVKDKTPDRIMCRQFARGMCTRGATCIYVHELILPQLPGVYTFCKNFQNTVCNFPKCKFVHATVFEKEHFYRTGYLPPHTLSHLKESNSALGPPTALEGTPAEASQVFSNPPPSMHPGVSALPTSGCAPPEARPNTELYGPIPTLVKSGSPTKREWIEAEVGPLGTREDSIEPMLKKCNTCDAYDLRLQCSKAKMEKAIEAAEKLSKQELQLKKRETKLNNIFDMLFIVSGMSQFSSNLMNPGMAVRNERDMQTREEPVTPRADGGWGRSQHALETADPLTRTSPYKMDELPNNLWKALAQATPQFYGESAILDRMRAFMQFNSRMYDMDMSQQSMVNQLIKMMKERGITR